MAGVSTGSSGSASKPKRFSIEQLGESELAGLMGSASHEDSITHEDNAKYWSKFYRLAKVSGDEGRQLMARCAVYIYCAINGTSGQGRYEGEARVGDVIIDASMIIGTTGPLLLRKWMRANMDESYTYFKKTAVLETDGRFVAKAAGMGIAPGVAFAIADWMDDCPSFTPAERDAHDRAFNFSVSRARRARGGMTTEQVQEADAAKALEAQGPATSAPSRGREIVL